MNSGYFGPAHVEAPISVDAVIVGGGIAGCWTAVKLLRKGVSTAVVYYDETDRGGKLGSTQLSVGAINTSPFIRGDFLDWLEDLGRGQVHTDVGSITRDHLATELDALLEFDPLKNIQLGVALKSGSARYLLDRLLKEIQYLGGRILDDAWVTRIVASERQCNGIQYERKGKLGAVYAGAVVIASGGYSGLYQGAVKTGTYGSVHGRLLQAGGWLSNVEFVFKHGYGQPDLGTLTPTEELPGAEIYDEQGNHVEWLEQELFFGRGTSNHFQAFMTWRKAGDLKYFVDFRYRDLHRTLKRIVVEGSDDIEDICANKETLIAELLSRCYEARREEFSRLLHALKEREVPYDYPLFNRIKTYVAEAYPEHRSRIRQISYFSMGGIAHRKFSTNLKNVFVCGEAMHDFGAHRVGGLPWALYLCAGKLISERIDLLKRRGLLSSLIFELDQCPSTFDRAILAKVQEGLQRYQETGLKVGEAQEFVAWLKATRAELINQGRHLDDAVAYLVMAEAIMKSSMVRQESRGCFFRDDIGEEDPALAGMRTLAHYDAVKDEVVVDLVAGAQIPDMIERGQRNMESDCAIENNAVYFLLKKHLDGGLGEQTAIETLSAKYSYQGLWELTNQYAGYMRANHIDEGDRVALLLEDRPEFVALFLAAQQIGAIAVPLNTFCKTAELLHYLDDSGAKLLISERGLLTRHSTEQLSERPRVTVVCFEDIALDAVESWPTIMPANAETIGFILYTSGSTGKPKGAIHRQLSMAYSAESFARHVLRMNAQDRLYSSSKLFFAYGLGNSLYFPLYFGATSLLSSAKATPDLVQRVLVELKPTVFFAVPAVYRAVLESGETRAELFACLRLCVSAGEALSPRLAQQWYRHTSVEVIDGIGSTEALHIFCVSNHSKPAAPHYGRPVPGYELGVVDDLGAAVGRNSIGELRVRGPSLAQGYWNNPDKTAVTFIKGWLMTGDRHFVNTQGEHVFVGRYGDTYKSSGLWVSTLEIEEAISELTYISEASVVVFQGHDGLLRSKAYVIARNVLSMEEKQNIEMDTQRFLRQKLSSYKVPHCIEAVDELPRTATGKVAKAVLREMAQEVIWMQPLREMSSQIPELNQV